MSELMIPESILQQYEQLCELCEKNSDNGRISAIDAAKFLNMNYPAFLNLIYTGKIPFAFGSNSGVGRGVSCIHTLPFFQFMTQGMVVNHFIQSGQLKNGKGEF